MPIAHHPAYLLFLTALAAVPVLALAWRGLHGPRLPRQWGRALLCLALPLLALVWADRLRGINAVLGLAALGYGILASRAGMRRLHRLRYGEAISQRLPQLAESDASALHLFFMLLAVACVTVGIVLATWPGGTP